MKLSYYILIICAVWIIHPSLGQETEIIERTFNETRIANGHSVETNTEGVLKFIVAHRFGAINKGIYDFFGFDDANMRLGFDYGIKNWWTIGIGRSSFNRTYDGYTKFKVLKQKKGAKAFPFTLAYFASFAVETQRIPDPEEKFTTMSRTTYVNQLLIARKFSNAISIQIMPSYVHRNMVPTKEDEHDIFAIGAAPKVQVSKRISITGEYYYVFPDQLAEGFVDAAAIGVEFETKGHVFQLSFGNSRGLIEKVFITETTDEWSEGEIHFGFNITRDFKLKGRKYRSYPE